jgi:hypothetical protein
MKKINFRILILINWIINRNYKASKKLINKLNLVKLMNILYQKNLNKMKNR